MNGHEDTGTVPTDPQRVYQYYCSNIRNRLRELSLTHVLSRTLHELTKFWHTDYIQAFQRPFPNANHLLSIAKWATVYCEDSGHHTRELTEERWAKLYNALVDFPSDDAVLAVDGVAFINRMILSSFGRQYHLQQGTGTYWFFIGFEVLTRYSQPHDRVSWADLLGYRSIEDFLRIHFVVTSTILKEQRGAVDINFWGDEQQVQQYLTTFAPTIEEFKTRATHDHRNLLGRRHLRRETDDLTFYLRQPFFTNTDQRVVGWQWQIIDYFLGSMPYDYIRSMHPESKKATFGGVFGAGFELFLKAETRAYFPTMWDEETLATQLGITDRDTRPDFAVQTVASLVIVEAKAGSMPRFGYNGWNAHDLRSSYNSTLAKSFLQLARALAKAKVRFQDITCYGVAVTYHPSFAGTDVRQLVEELFASKPMELEEVRPFADRIMVCHAMEYLNFLDYHHNDWDAALQECLTRRDTFICDGRVLHESRVARLQASIHELIQAVAPAFGFTQDV